MIPGNVIRVCLLALLRSTSDAGVDFVVEFEFEAEALGVGPLATWLLGDCADGSAPARIRKETAVVTIRVWLIVNLPFGIVRDILESCPIPTFLEEQTRSYVRS